MNRRVLVRCCVQVCRNSTGCKAEAVCDGTNIQCPESRPAPINTVCFIPQGNPCRLTAHCDGRNTTCPEIREEDGTECMWSPFDDASLFKLVRQPASFRPAALSSRPAARYIPPARRFGSKCRGRRCDDDNEDSEYDSSAGDYPRRDYHDGNDYKQHKDYLEYKEELPHNKKRNYPACEGTCSAGHCFKALEASGCCVINGREYSDDGLYCWGH